MNQYGDWSSDMSHVDSNNNHAPPSSYPTESAIWFAQQHIKQDQQDRHSSSLNDCHSRCLDPRNMDHLQNNMRAPKSADSQCSSPFLDQHNTFTSHWSDYSGSPELGQMMASAGSFDDEEEEEEDRDKIPYNRLLFDCFMSMPNQECSLKDIYEWFRRNTTKAADPRVRGWQNSIRHNLSMNVAFDRGSRTNPNNAEKTSWYLTDKAIKEGAVEPTTRFRRNNQRSTSKGRHARGPYPSRQPAVPKVRYVARRPAQLRNVASGRRSQSPADPWVDVNSRHSTPVLDDDLTGGSHQQGNLTSGIGLGIGSIDYGDMFGASCPSFGYTSSPAYAPWHHPTAANIAFDPPRSDPEHVHGLMNVSQYVQAGVHSDQWMCPPQRLQTSASLTPPTETSSPEACYLGGLPSDVKPANIFEDDGPASSPTGPMSSGAPQANNLGFEFPDEFFSIGGSSSQQS